MSTPHEPDSDMASARAILDALPPASIDPAFSKGVLLSAQRELRASQNRWRGIEMLFARVLVPAALLLCALGWTYHVAHVAGRIFVSHGG